MGSVSSSVALFLPKYEKDLRVFPTVKYENGVCLEESLVLDAGCFRRLQRKL